MHSCELTAGSAGNGRLCLTVIPFQGALQQRLANGRIHHGLVRKVGIARQMAQEGVVKRKPGSQRRLMSVSKGGGKQTGKDTNKAYAPRAMALVEHQLPRAYLFSFCFSGCTMIVVWPRIAMTLGEFSASSLHQMLSWKTDAVRPLPRWL